ncbi:MAG: hypothetical protein ABSG52_03465 [Terriglobales bacterium]
MKKPLPARLTKIMHQNAQQNNDAEITRIIAENSKKTSVRTGK